MTGRHGRFLLFRFNLFLLVFLSRHTTHNSPKSKSDHIPATYPTEYLRHIRRMRTFEVTILCACMVGRQRCRVVAHIYYHGVGKKLRSSKTRKKLTFYANKISRQAVARRIPGRLWKMGYHIDPHVIPDSNAVLLFLGGSFFRPFRVL